MIAAYWTWMPKKPQKKKRPTTENRFRYAILPLLYQPQTIAGSNTASPSGFWGNQGLNQPVLVSVLV
jgi:hypothetical protein